MQPGSTALVTGAASGIGLALSRLLSARDYALHLFDIDEDALNQAAHELRPHSATVGNVADPAAMQELANETGAVDLLCLNAGVASTEHGAPWLAAPEEWDRVLGVNLLGVVNGLRSYVPAMLASNRPCNIVVTASLAGATTWPGGGPYAASKHAALAVAEQAALELAGTNVAVTVLCPALVRSRMSQTGREPDEIALEALAAVAANRFAVLPTAWATAVSERAAMLGSGTQPTIPHPRAE